MKSKDGIFRQRVGYLIELHICDKFKLYYNKRQRTQGYYDAYNQEHIYEIKASSTNNNTFIVRLQNHKRLCAAGGLYIFVSYKLRNKDKNLSVISDIDIIQIRTIKATDINITKKNISISFKDKPNKQYARVYMSDINKLQVVANVL